MQERYAPHVAFDLITAASRVLCVLSQLLRYLRFKSLVLFVQRLQLLSSRAWGSWYCVHAHVTAASYLTPWLMLCVLGCPRDNRYR